MRKANYDNKSPLEPQRKNITLQDIAKACGVSTSTVSKILNNTAGSIRTSPVTRLQILEMAKKMGYMKHQIAMGLHLGNKTVSIIINNPANPLEQSEMVGFERQAKERDIDCFFCFVENDVVAFLRTIENSLNRHVRGFAFKLPNEDPGVIQSLRELHQRGIPVVLIDRSLEIPGCDFDLVESENYEGACLMTKHLLSIGHKGIFFMRYAKSLSTLDERQRGFKDTIIRNKIPWSIDFVVTVSDRNNKKEITSALQEVMRSPYKPTAIFADTDHLALNLLKICHELDISVPEDIAIVGFDDLPHQIPFQPFVEHIDWSLTTVRQNNIELGYNAAKLLIDKIEGIETEVKHIRIPVDLVVRSTCGINLEKWMKNL